MTSLTFPFVPVRIELQGRVFEENAILDTGFDGEIAIPKAYAEGLEPEGSEPFAFPDGTVVEPDKFTGIVRLADMEPTTAEIVALGSEFIVGIRILIRYEVILDHGQRVIINP